MVCIHYDNCDLKVSSWVYERGCLDRGVSFSDCPKRWVAHGNWRTPKEWKEAYAKLGIEAGIEK